MIITCPNCQTRYQVADHAIGSAGRKVQCANCHQSWRATASIDDDLPPKPRIVAGTDTDFSTPAPSSADHDRLFGGDGETALDKAFSEEEARLNPRRPEATTDDEDVADKALEEESLDHHLLTRRKRDLVRRQRKHASRLPLARFRRIIRTVALAGLIALLGAAYLFRVDIVRVYPQLGGLYQMVGVDVNIYGLVFSNVGTLRTLRDGDDVTIITAKIRNIIDHTVRVPAVLVSILNARGVPIYEWTARAPVDNISPGDVIAFETQLSSAPAESAHVRLIFDNGTAPTDGAAADTNKGAL